MTIRIFLLDDHELVRTGLRTLLAAEDDMEVVGEAGTAELGLSMILNCNPMWRSLTCDYPTATGSKCAGRFSPFTPRCVA